MGGFKAYKRMGTANGGCSDERTTKTMNMVDGGDPDETRRVKSLIGFVDGQTTNPTLIAKNPGNSTPNYLWLKVEPGRTAARIP